ncbi:MAG: nickel-dependent hydrogenase large subunit [Betaproteobacteria bacterium]|nr:nickel-dependent hydrogenase large subunit [Betaproteobacteria bacterium]
MSRLVVGPFNRVEGDLEIALDLIDGRVREARIKAPLFRGFESLLVGRPVLDALVIVPRICGICSVSQSIAAAAAIADACGAVPPPNGERALNLMHAAENLADHFTHFYLFFLPDFAREVYRGRPWFAAAERRFKAMRGSAAREVPAVRTDFLRVMGYLAGKWPHSLSIQPGGSSRAVKAAERVRLLALVREFRAYLETRTFGDALENIAAIHTVESLTNWRETRAPESSDFRLFLEIARDCALQDLGRASDHFLSFGAYRKGDSPVFARGHWYQHVVHALDPAGITEDHSHAWLAATDAPLAPTHGVTQPLLDKPDAYTWCKAPRLYGSVVETGALARQLIDGHPLARALVVESGGNVRNRVLARLLEVARLVPLIEGWLQELEAGAPYFAPLEMPRHAEGMGLVEAARGSLGHWITIEDGRLAHYQIISPTTWNFSPRDRNGQPGAAELALQGAPVQAGEDTPVAVQHVVRSFDPCMVCTVH